MTLYGLIEEINDNREIFLIMQIRWSKTPNTAWEPGLS